MKLVNTVAWSTSLSQSLDTAVARYLYLSVTPGKLEILTWLKYVSISRFLVHCNNLSGKTHNSYLFLVEFHMGGQIPRGHRSKIATLKTQAKPRLNSEK